MNYYVSEYVNVKMKTSRNLKKHTLSFQNALFTLQIICINHSLYLANKRDRVLYCGYDQTLCLTTMLMKFDNNYGFFFGKNSILCRIAPSLPDGYKYNAFWKKVPIDIIRCLKKV